MKHARAALTKMAQSAPSFEEAYAEIPVEDTEVVSAQNDAVDAANLINENEGLYSEADDLSSRADRMGTLVDYVESQVNVQEGGATQNEVALVEQAVDGALDGTGEDVEEVLPSLESAVGSTISMEGVKESIEKFLSATKEMVTTAASNFTKFFKGVFNRITALKNRIEKLEGKLSGEIKESVEARVLLAANAMCIDGKAVSTVGEMTTATTNLTGLINNIVNNYCPEAVKLNDEFGKLVDNFFSEGYGRGEEKQGRRDASEKDYVDNVNKLIALNNRVSDGKEYIGDFSFVKNEGGKASEFKTSGKVARQSIPKESEESDFSADATLSGLTKGTIQKHLTALKGSLGLLNRVKSNTMMLDIDFFTRKFMYGPLDPAIDLAMFGGSTTRFTETINAINRVYMESYTQTPMKVINHFFRVADAQLTVLEKAVKK